MGRARLFLDSTTYEQSDSESEPAEELVFTWETSDEEEEDRMLDAAVQKAAQEYPAPQATPYTPEVHIHIFIVNVIHQN